ncbi:MAG TPA: polymer-forming cytoskeletal protein [Longimicrobiales bacterium]
MTQAPMIVAEGFELGGRLALTRPAIVNGRLHGAIQSTSSIVVGPTAVVDAEVRARSVTVRGTVVGDITADDSIHVERGARVAGNLTAPEVVIDPGADFEGACRMAPPDGPAAPRAESDAPRRLRA